MHKFILLYFSSDTKINIHINIISNNIQKTADAVYEFIRDKMRLSKVFKIFNVFIKSYHTTIKKK